MKTLLDRFFPRYSKVILLILVGLSFFFGYWLRGNSQEARFSGLAHQEAPNKAAVKLAPGTLYACPMMCISPREVAGNCPVCGMELVPLPGHDHEAGTARLTLSEKAVHLAGIRTAPVERQFVSTDIRAFGQIVVDGFGFSPEFAAKPMAKIYIYESDFVWLRHGQSLTFETDTYPGRNFEGKIAFIGVYVDPATRTYTVGAEPQGSVDWLLPGMIIRATIHIPLDENGQALDPEHPPQKPPLVIPASAPLITGKRAVVYLAVPGEEDVFEGREISLGRRAGDYYLVQSGLVEGDLVVVNGNFKIDSALQIMGRPSMMAPQDKAAEPQ
jgi:hypothetical protein